ncbi:MAG TPA: LuxR C-terminal-related transcriptional regulator [Rhodocyclaceae bacterium]
MDAGTAERIHVHWDELADFDAGRIDDALDHLLGFLCELVDAQNATWVGAVRLADILPGDPVHGWRPRTIRFLQPSRPLEDNTREQAKNLEQGSVDETTIRNVALAGAFRANRLCDLVPPAWFDSDYYRVHYCGVGHADAIWVGFPVNEDGEAYFGIFRDSAHPRFSEAERDAVAYALRGLKWFHRQQLLGHGLLVASSPLTPSERTVLQGLLTGQSEKQIAAGLQKSFHTTHDCVTSIFRKFNVNNRPALMALWLGSAT